jgi:regulator of replication initiation timing
MKSKMQEVL